MSGVIFWGWDLGGFSGEVPSPELYVRSAAMACFCPIMQYHAESKAEFNQDRTPWNIAERSDDERALTGYRFYANLRMSLLPYLEREAAWCVAEKQPLLRAMLLDFQGDSRAAALWDQYLFGRDLLVAPIIREGEISREVYLPAGRWWHLFENRWYDGGQSHEVSASFAEIPVFLRAGAALPLAFQDEARLGATMPSDIAGAKISVLLIAGREPGTSLHHEDLDIEVSGDLVRVTSRRTRPIKLVFTNPPAQLELNGVVQQAGTLNLSGVELATFELV